MYVEANVDHEYLSVVLSICGGIAIGGVPAQNDKAVRCNVGNNN